MMFDVVEVLNIFQILINGELLIKWITYMKLYILKFLIVGMYLRGLFRNGKMLEDVERIIISMAFNYLANLVCTKFVHIFF